MENFIISNKIKLQQSSIHGIGVFAKETIEENEIIEISPLLQLEWKLKYVHDRIVRDYSWMNNSCQCQDCKMHGPSLYMALGYGSMYNHHDNPNTSVFLDYKDKKIQITANKKIEVGEEIFVTYGSKYFSAENRSHKQSLSTKG
jgi:SET domain-containing protein